MKYKIEQKDNGIEITVSEVEGKESRLWECFKNAVKVAVPALQMNIRNLILFR